MLNIDVCTYEFYFVLSKDYYIIIVLVLLYYHKIDIIALAQSSITA